MTLTAPKLYETADKEGKYAEDRLVEVLNTLNIYNIYNVRGEKKYQGQDIDLVLGNKKNPLKKKITVEVKSDNNCTSPNFAIESVSNVSKGTQGWGYNTKADLIVIYYPKIDTFYVLDGKALTTWFAAHADRKKKNGKDEFFEIMNSTQDRYNPSKILYKSKFRLVPRATVEKEIDIVNCFIAADYLAEERGDK